MINVFVILQIVLAKFQFINQSVFLGLGVVISNKSTNVLIVLRNVVLENEERRQWEPYSISDIVCRILEVGRHVGCTSAFFIK